MNIVDVIKKESADKLENIAVIEGERQISYENLFKQVDSLSEKLKQRGIKPYQRIGFLSSDSIEYIIISLSILSINAVLVPISESLAKEEIDSVIEKIDLDGIVYDSKLFGCEKAKEILSTKEKHFFLWKTKSTKKLPPEYSRINPAFIRFSSGTTGTQKGVVISHQAIFQRANAVNEGFKVNSQDRIIWVLPMSFHFTATITLFLRQAATIILCGNNFSGFLNAGLSRKPTFIYASPFYYQTMAAFKQVSKELLENLRLAVSTAVRLPEKVSRDFCNKFNFELSEAYGIIEVGIPFINNSANKTKRGSVGKILPDYKVKIDSKTGNIYLKGKGVFEAYFLPWQLRENITEDNWFDTGDIGHLDKDGFLFITGRKKNLINFSGLKVFPYRVESVLNSYDGIRESRVYPESHPQFGQIPVADIVLEEEKEEEFDLKDLRKFCYKHLSSYKVPKKFRFKQKLTRTPSGKIKRN